MEKGNSKTSSAPKSNSSDSKNKQDGGANKHLRLPRVKEGISPRPDNRRKSNPQRNRELFDKRPRNRTGAVYERYRSEVADGSVCDPTCKQGGKKTNLNHLLNFTLTPPDNWEGNGRRAVYNNRPKLPKYNKELFLQANSIADKPKTYLEEAELFQELNDYLSKPVINMRICPSTCCQFVARDNGNYIVHQNNPDILVEWSLIEEIRLPCYEVPLCPICLYVPVAAKITRCGHIYCWPCLLHYLSLTDKTWQKCPICFEAVHKTELKSVSLKVQKCFAVGDEITMCLMQRGKGSLLPTPVIHQIPSNPVCNVDDVDTLTRYQKLLLASPKEVQLILDREHSELNQAYLEEKDTPEVCFIESALELLVERERCLNLEMDNEGNVMNKEILQKHTNGSVRKHLNSISSIDSTDEGHNNDVNDNPAKWSDASNLNNAVKTTSNDSEKGICFFYQAEDGQHIYLQNVNVRMLLKEFGSLEAAPHTITAKIVEVERVTMTEVLRKRLRYLQHLPLTCEFQIVELDFGIIVSEPTMAQFESEIKKRRFVRSKKARDERRREKIIEREENKKLGKYPKATYNINSVDQFPAYHPEDFLSLSPPKEGINAEIFPDPVANLNSYNDDAFPSGYLEESVAPDLNYVPATSFAQKLRDGPKTFKPMLKDVKSNASASNPIQPKQDSDDENTPAPEYRQSFSDALQAAFDSMALQGPTDNSQSSSKKKKKAKNKLLFTTAMCRNNK